MKLRTRIYFQRFLFRVLRLIRVGIAATLVIGFLGGIVWLAFWVANEMRIPWQYFLLIGMKGIY